LENKIFVEKLNMEMKFDPRDRFDFEKVKDFLRECKVQKGGEKIWKWFNCKNKLVATGWLTENGNANLDFDLPTVKFVQHKGKPVSDFLNSFGN
jgi:hypothetical protein